MNRALLRLLIVQLIFWLSGLIFIQDKPVIALLTYPEFFVYTVLAGLASFAVGAYENKKLPSRLFEFFTFFLYFYGLFSLCLIPISGLGFVEWLYCALYLILRLGITQGGKGALPRLRMRSLFDVSVILLLLGLIRRIIDLVLPVNMYVEHLQYSTGMKVFLFWVLMGLLIVFALRFLERLYYAVKKGSKKSADAETDADDRREPEAIMHTRGQMDKPAIDLLVRLLKGFSWVLYKLVRGAGRLIAQLVRAVGLVPVVIGTAVIVLVPLILISVEIQRFILALQEFVWGLGSSLLKNLSTRRWYQPYGILEKLRDFILLLLVFIFMLINQSEHKATPRRTLADDESY